MGALDSSEQNSSNTLKNVGIDKKNIFLVENKPEIAEKHRKKSFKIFEGDLKDYSENIKDNKDDKNDNKKCAGWYFDMCGNITKQENGILNTLKNTDFINKSVLGFTFCRTRHKKELYCKEKILFVKKFNKILLNKGFNSIKILDHDYSGNYMFKRIKKSHMNSFIYKLNEI